MKSFALALVAIGILGIAPAKCLASFSGEWVGDLKFVSSESNEQYADCHLTIEQTDKKLTLYYSAGTCESLNTADDGYDILSGKFLFINGLALGTVTSSAIQIDFIDLSQGHRMHLTKSVELTEDGSLLLYESLKGNGYLSHLVGKFKRQAQ